MHVSLPAQSNTEAAVKKTINDFYTWYTKNSGKLDAFRVLRGKGNAEGPPFRIDWQAANKYFAYIRKSVPGLGEQFIGNETTYFKVAEKAFKANPTDEIATGFDFDRFTGGQESPEYVVPYLLDEKGTWKYNIKGNNCTLTIHPEGSTGPTEAARAQLVKEGGKWKIAVPFGYPEGWDKRL
jgi:hypothetical protein